jgi:hypothetical protein
MQQDRMSGNGGNFELSIFVLRDVFWSLFNVKERIAVEGRLEPCLFTATTVISYIVYGMSLSILTSYSDPGT